MAAEPKAATRTRPSTTQRDLKCLKKLPGRGSFNVSIETDPTCNNGHLATSASLKAQDRCEVRNDPGRTARGLSTTTADGSFEGGAQPPPSSISSGG